VGFVLPQVLRYLLARTSPTMCRVDVREQGVFLRRSVHVILVDGVELLSQISSTGDLPSPPNAVG